MYLSGLRSVKSSQCYSQSSADEARKKYCGKEQNITTCLVTDQHCRDSLARCKHTTTYRDGIRWATDANSNQEINLNVILHQKGTAGVKDFEKIENDAQAKNDVWYEFKNYHHRRNCGAYLWHWNTLEKKCSKTGKWEHDKNQSDDWNKTFHRQQREFFLLKSSVLQVGE